MDATEEGRSYGTESCTWSAAATVAITAKISLGMVRSHVSCVCIIFCRFSGVHGGRYMDNMSWWRDVKVRLICKGIGGKTVWTKHVMFLFS